MKKANGSDYLPVPAQEDFLELLFDPGTQASALASRLEDFDAAAAGFEIASLLPLLLERWGTSLPEAVRRQAQEIHDFFAFRNQILLARLAEVLEQLRAAGIPTMVLKGVAMVQAYYRDPGLRFMEDADLMVPQECIPKALDLLSASGWRWKWPKRLSPTVLAAAHAIDMKRADGTKIDLHWHLFSLVWHPGTDAPFWNRSRPCSVHGVETRVLCPEDQMLHTCVHGAQYAPHYQPERPLRWIADAMTILGKTPAFDWELFCEEARLRRFCLPLSVAVSHLQGRYGAPVPPHILECLADTPVSEFERADFVRLSSPRNALGGWQRKRLMWQRYRKWSPDTVGLRRWVGFAIFLQHLTRKSSFSSLLLELIKGRFR